MNPIRGLHGLRGDGGVRSGMGTVLRREETAGFDFSEAFFKGEELRDLPPLVGVAQVSEVEVLLSHVLKSGELGLKNGESVRGPSEQYFEQK